MRICNGVKVNVYATLAGCHAAFAATMSDPEWAGLFYTTILSLPVLLKLYSNLFEKS